MSEIRELAMRLLAGINAHERFEMSLGHYARLEQAEIESLVRAAMREGMLRSADISKLYANEEEESSSFQCGAAACERMIRAEAAKLETN